MTYTLPTLKCLRCGASWTPRSPQPPVKCPRCTSPYWDRAVTRVTRKETK